MFIERQGLVVWLHTVKHTKVLQRFGNLHYVSRRMKYAVIYCNMDDIDAIAKEIATITFVKKVEPSYKPFIKLEFEGKKLDYEKQEELVDKD